VDPVAGVVLHQKPGEAVEPGRPLADLHAQDTSRLGDRLDEAERRLLDAFSFSEEPPEIPPLLMDRYADGAWQNGG
jgi:thymidine phosphorylase